MTEVPRAPAHVDLYVQVLGVDLAVQFLLAFGGAELYIAAQPGPQSQLVKVLGYEAAVALAAAAEGHGARWQARVPTGKPWIAKVWHAQGLPKAEIARRLHVTDVAVRGWLSAEPKPARSRTDPRQASFL